MGLIRNPAFVWNLLPLMGLEQMQRANFVTEDVFPSSFGNAQEQKAGLGMTLQLDSAVPFLIPLPSTLWYQHSCSAGFDSLLALQAPLNLDLGATFDLIPYQGIKKRDQMISLYTFQFCRKISDLCVKSILLGAYKGQTVFFWDVLRLSFAENSFRVSGGCLHQPTCQRLTTLKHTKRLLERSIVLSWSFASSSESNDPVSRSCIVA